MGTAIAFPILHNFTTWLHNCRVQWKRWTRPTPARALTRTPILSVAALGGIEASHIAYAVEQGENLVKEIGKSGITLGTTLLASGYLGAIGAKYAGPCGSLIGVGLGSVIGYKTSKAFN